jgi:hypothetical protein
MTIEGDAASATGVGGVAEIRDGLSLRNLRLVSARDRSTREGRINFR